MAGVRFPAWEFSSFFFLFCVAFAVCAFLSKNINFLAIPVDKRDVQSHDHSIRSSKTLECKVSDSPTTDEVPSNLDELTQLDDILERAQKIRLSQVKSI